MSMILLQTPTPVDPGSPSLTLWANLPLIACATFGIATVIGLIVIMLKNRSMARQYKIQQDTQPVEKEN